MDGRVKYMIKEILDMPTISSHDDIKNIKLALEVLAKRIDEIEDVIHRES